MPIYNQRTGEVEYAQIFVAVLGASGYTYVHATPSQTQEDFIYSHVKWVQIHILLFPVTRFKPSLNHVLTFYTF
jgi:hypothetical protein